METVTTDITEKKPNLDEADKFLISQKFGAILKKYPTDAKIRSARLPVTASLFEPLSKTSSKGYMVEVSGNIEKIDFVHNRVTIDGRGYKISAIFKLTVPPEFDGEEKYLDSGWSDSSDKPICYEGDHRSAGQPCRRPKREKAPDFSGAKENKDGAEV